MKILFTQKINGISGSELYLLQILPELKRRGHDVEMLLIFPAISTKNDVFKAQLQEANVPCYEIYGHGNFSPALILKISKFVKKGNYDLVQSNLIHADLWFALVKMFFLKDMKLISVKHGYSEAYSAKYGYNLRHIKSDPFYWIQKFACRMTDFNLAISKGLYNVYVNSRILVPSKIKVINYGLKLKLPYLDEFEATTHERYLLITGRLVGFKGHKYLIKAWAKVNKYDPELKLYIAGDGVLRQELEDLVSTEKLEHVVKFWGHVTNPHLLIKNALFTIVSSTWEGFGLVLLESWQHKKAIVAFDVPAMNEVIDDEVNGLLAQKENSNDLAVKIIKLLQDEQRIREYGNSGYEKLNSYYTLKRMTDETEEVYRSIVHN